MAKKATQAMTDLSALCVECRKPADDIGKQMLKRRDGTEQVFCGQACRSKYEADAEEFYRWHKK